MRLSVFRHIIVASLRFRRRRGVPALPHRGLGVLFVRDEGAVAVEVVNQVLGRVVCQERAQKECLNSNDCVE